VAVAERGKWRVSSRCLEGMHNVSNASQDVIGGAGSWHAYMGGEPCDGVTDACRVHLHNPYSVAVVGVPGGANVPPFHAMGRPTAMCI